eukprot:CAMPEP_0206388170 /NCGR_PEP_ID=MMETSP0294-20121207/17094_1 /ASSEMBLY_ACC=CAM_ASM_000327 /TAXON_ID=39354 /ORGANISM="Heterosigma akashiwo, Strain CCMP2393" /LENGTH=175 /DNA_ID=CAMNT_0053839787 /DNA_START=309 /DNA_END=837 /DNA_ORIENTATION=+
MELKATSFFVSLPWACCCALLPSLCYPLLCCRGCPFSLTILSTASFGLAVLVAAFPISVAASTLQPSSLPQCSAAPSAIATASASFASSDFLSCPPSSSLFAFVSSDFLSCSPLSSLFSPLTSFASSDFFTALSLSPVCATALITSLPPCPGFLLFLALLLLGSTALLHWSLILL